MPQAAILRTFLLFAVYSLLSAISGAVLAVQSSGSLSLETKAVVYFLLPLELLSVVAWLAASLGVT